jgi:hypothetical protein
LADRRTPDLNARRKHMNQVASENNAKRKPHSIMEIAGGILGCAFLLGAAFLTYHMVVSQIHRAWNFYNVGNWAGAAGSLVIAILVVSGVMSWFRK